MGLGHFWYTNFWNLPESRPPSSLLMHRWGGGLCCLCDPPPPTPRQPPPSPQATWIETLWGTLGESGTIRTINAMNAQRLSAASEIVLGRWRDPAQLSIDFLTDFKSQAECRGACGADRSSAEPMRAALLGGGGSMRGNDYRPKPVYSGYQYVPFAGIGVVYKKDQEVSSLAGRGGAATCAGRGGGGGP